MPTSRPKTFVSSVSSPGKRKLASMPVSASGESDARSSIAMRTSSSQSRSSGANVTRPSSSASSGPSAWPCRSSSWTSLAGIAAEPCFQAAASVHRRQHVEVECIERDLRRFLFFRQRQHVAAVGCQRQFQQYAGKARSRLDDRVQAARRHIQPRQRSPQQSDGFAHQPVVAMLQHHRITCQHGLDDCRSSSAAPARVPAHSSAASGWRRRARAPWPAATTGRRLRESLAA